MTAMRAELHPFRLALREPLVTGGVSVRFRAGVLVSLSAEGLTGWGEASPLPGWSHNTLLETEAALRGALDGINTSGEAALDTLIGNLPDAPHARAGVAGAWTDLQARRAGRTLAEHLGRAAGGAGELLGGGSSDAPASTVAVNALIAVFDPSDVEQAAHDAVEAGFEAVKLKVGVADPAVDGDRVRAARSGLGPRVELRLDANGAWDELTAIDVLGRVQGCNIAYCEEPVAGIEAIAAVGKRTQIPVAVDESMRRETDAVRALDLGVSTLIVKPQALGGPDIALSIAARARRFEASAVVTSFLDSAVGLAHALHVAAVVDAAAPDRRAHGLATARLLVQDVATPPRVVTGAMSLPTAAGLGVDPDTAPE